jgi:hypothetical protein
MKRDEWMLLSLTFLTGLAIGMYVYIVAFKPTYAPENLSGVESEANEWSMVGKRRAEFHNSDYVYPSFRLLGDGSYLYLPSTTGDEAVEPVEGKISSSAMRQIRKHDELIASYTMPDDINPCNGDIEGFEYEYRVTVDRTVYILDTCRTVLGHDSEYALAIRQVWDEIEGTSSSKPRGSVSDWLEDWIRRNIGTD